MLDPESETKKPSAGFDALSKAYPYLGYLPWVVLVTLLFVLYAAVKLMFAPTLYQATTILKLTEVTKPISALITESGGGEPDTVLQTYVEEARSYNVASRTAQALDVSSVPAFKNMDKQILANILADRVAVKNYRSTNLIQVQALAETPKLAADLANTWANCFIEEDLSIVHGGAASLHHFLDEQSAHVLEQMNQSQQLLKANSGKSGGKMVEQDLATQVSSLEQRIIQLRDEQASLESKYKAGHPLVRNHQAELDRAVADRNQLLERSGDASWLNIVHQIKALENTSDWLMEKEQETMVSENMSASNILVVDPAVMPYNPSFPQRRQDLMKAAVKGVLVGFALVWLWLFLRRPVQREEDLELAAGGPFLGLVPDSNLEGYLVPPASYPADWITKYRLRRPLYLAKAAFYQADQRWRTTFFWRKERALPSLPDDARHRGTFYHGAFDGIRDRLLQDPAWQAPVCVAVFSPGEAEGRSTVNAGLALALAQAGKRVLLVDANPWHPALAPLFGMEAADRDASLYGNAPQPRETRYAGLHLLPGSADPGVTLDWAASQRLKSLVSKWKAQYDCIVMDPPPFNSFSGAQNIADATDGIVMMARSGRTGHGNLKNVMDLVKARRIRVFGSLLNRADVRYYSQAHHYFYAHSGLGRRVTETPMLGRL